MNQSIVHIALVVQDYDEAIKFYTEKLHFTLIEDTYQNEQDKRWVVVSPPNSTGTTILLAKASNPIQEEFIGNQAGGRVFLFLGTDDFHRDYSEMIEKGIEFVREPKVADYGTVAVFKDLYGNLWDLVQFTDCHPMSKRVVNEKHLSKEIGMYQLNRVVDKSTKSVVCNLVLRSLPTWFGIEESIVEYVKTTQEMPFWVAYDGEIPIGFIALKKHNNYTIEICVMGVLKQYHRKGVGRKLIETVEQYCQGNKNKYLTVKTLDESREDESYEKTRKFYYAMGFLPLEVFPLLWDVTNPCLFMVKHLDN